MKYIILSLAIFIIFSPEATTQEKCKITYISNEGFLLEYNDTKLLIDGAFGPVDGDWADSPSPETIQLIRDSKPPFDNIDIIAVTHKHQDHFTESVIVDHLLSNTDGILICPEQVGEILKANGAASKFSNRIISFTPAFKCDTLFDIDNITVRMMRLEHSHFMETDSLTGEEKNRHSDIENLGFLFDINGKKFFHCGDTNPANEKEYEIFALNEENIDVAFIERLFYAYGEKTISILKTNINPRKTILMHINPANRDLFIEYLKSEDDIIIFKERMESVMINLEH